MNNRHGIQLVKCGDLSSIDGDIPKKVVVFASSIYHFDRNSSEAN
jgi:hypothetical protein